MSKKPTVLMILDGYGLNSNCDHNAVCEGRTPVMETNIKEIIELCTYTEKKSGRFLPAYIHIRNKKSTALI